MDDTALAAIEQALAIQLPKEYRRLMGVRGDSLKRLTFKFNGQEQPYFKEDLFLDPKVVIDYNQSERPTNTGTGYAFPKWWETFFMVGSNGGGDYYTLRLDNAPGVWLIGSDCGDEPEKTHESLEAYIQARLDRYQAEVIQPPPTPPPTDYERMTPQERAVYESQWFTVPDDESPFLAKIIAAPEDDAPRLALADWLEKEGQQKRAHFIRARCALDGKSPEPDTYPNAVEMLREAVHGWLMKYPKMPRGFSFYSSDMDLAEWWSDNNDRWERGLPSYVNLVLESNDPAVDAPRVIESLPTLIQTTPVRGINLEWHLPHRSRAIFAQPEAAKLTRLSFSSRPEEERLCPVIVALSTSPVARNLTRLEIDEGVQYDCNADALANAPFDRLQRFGVSFISSSPAAARRLLNSPWFQRLQRLHIGFALKDEADETLGNLRNLHTLSLWFPKKTTLTGLGQSEYPALRRLFIHGANLRGKVAEALAGMKSTRLVELWVRNSALRKEDLRKLLASPWATALQVLTLECTLPDESVVDVIAESPCAAHLRILRFHWAGFPRLAGTALGRPGAFPKLSTLELSHPYEANDPSTSDGSEIKDTADFLQTLYTPSLRFLKLEGCDVDEKCRKALAANKNLRALERLEAE
jgi:uncharacterized protein (TIGR02996 family)